jgi:hypothetical protein
MALGRAAKGVFTEDARRGVWCHALAFNPLVEVRFRHAP